jgi:hypothetical protein
MPEPADLPTLGAETMFSDEALLQMHDALVATAIHMPTRARF